jgi:hypothetical protein
MLIISWHRGNRQRPKHYVRTRTTRGGDCRCPSRHPLASRTRDSQPSTPLQYTISGMFHAVTQMPLASGDPPRVFDAATGAEISRLGTITLPPIRPSWRQALPISSPV